MRKRKWKKTGVYFEANLVEGLCDKDKENVFRKDSTTFSMFQRNCA